MDWKDLIQPLLLCKMQESQVKGKADGLVMDMK